MYLFLSKTLFTFMFLLLQIAFEWKGEVCETLLMTVDINSNAYKNCLLQKSEKSLVGDK